jgi:uncharacterized protein (DUF1800 family)
MGAKLSAGVVTGLRGGQNAQPTLVQLPFTYANPVVVTTLLHRNADWRDQPAVTVTGAKDDQFRIQVRAGGDTKRYDVAYLVVEAGRHDLGADGRLEAHRVEAVPEGGPTTGSQPGRRLTLGLSFQQPVVLGQVMSDNAGHPSAFWACGGSHGQRPNSSAVHVGHYRLPPNDHEAAAESLGVVVFESGVTTVGQTRIEAGHTGLNVPYKRQGRRVQPVTGEADLALVAPAGFSDTLRPARPFVWARHDGDFPTASLDIAADGTRQRVEDQLYRAGWVTIGQVGSSTGPVDDAGASRFLMQAAFGGDRAAVDEVKNLGYAGWIDAQLALPVGQRSRTAPYLRSIAELRTPTPGPGVPYFVNDQWRYPNAVNFTTAWAHNIAYNNDQLRQRVTWALSQIFVVSAELGGLDKAGVGLGDFYDRLSEHALGSYEALLADVSLHPVMAHFLSSLHNRRAPDDDPNQKPDENYAREVMQLFSIGLWQLTADGREVLDGQGQPIPTYDNSDVEELARVFTGLKVAGKPIGAWVNTRDDFGRNLTFPVDFDESEHDSGAKSLPNVGITAPAGMTGEAEIRHVVAQLADHPNVGPFLCRRLIQALVKSNPSPNYVGRAAAVFANDGSGTRGNLGAVVRAILLDPEARSAQPTTGQYPSGKFLEPMLRTIRLFRAFPPAKNTGAEASLPNGGQLVPLPSSEFTFAVRTFVSVNLGQLPLHAPSVFNFYSPGYREGGPLLGPLITPEFQLANPASSVHLANFLRQLIMDRYTRDVLWTLPDHHVLNFTALADLVDSPNAMVDEAEVLLAGGQLSPATRDAATTLVSVLKSQNRGDYAIAASVVYLIAMSPDGAVLS